MRAASIVAGIAVACLATRNARAQEAVITPHLIAEHIGVLAHDSMRGRATPGPELEQAADWVEARFRRLGLAQAGEEGTYRQRFPVTRSGDAAGPTAPNVVAMLRGRDPALRGQYVLVVAHVDHLGVGRPVGGDSIRNGADDNASGTAGLLAIAEAFAGQRPAPRRSILFLVVSGEERGLLGSRWYAEHPTVPLDSIVAVVNLDMISRNRPDSVYLNGWGKSSISDLVVRLAGERRDLGLSVGPDEEDRPVTPADSDHYPFQRLGIPYIFFYTGPHADYHRVGDHAEATDADKASRIARLAFITMLGIADNPAAPEWTAESRRLNVVRP
jgi:acetylornithine deacetylase/succinyl-diaminopimelate desuccinylase-like protein